MFGTIVEPLMDRVKVLPAARAVQELEAHYLAGTTGRAGGRDQLAAAGQADGLDGTVAEVPRRSRGSTQPAAMGSRSGLRPRRHGRAGAAGPGRRGRRGR